MKAARICPGDSCTASVRVQAEQAAQMSRPQPRLGERTDGGQLPPPGGHRRFDVAL